MTHSIIKAVAFATIPATIISASAAIFTYHRGEQSRQQADQLQAEVLKLNTALANRSARLTVAPAATTPHASQPPKSISTQSAIGPSDSTLASLADKDAEIARLQTRIAELEAEAATREERRRSMSERMNERMARMKAENPEEYEKRRQEGQERMQNISAITSARLERMKAIPIDGLSPEYLKNHLAVLERLEFFDTTMAKLAENPDRENMRALMPQIFMNMHGLDEMLVMEREIMLTDLARDLGYEDHQTGSFVAAVNDITEATTMPSPQALMRGRHDHNRQRD